MCDREALINDVEELNAQYLRAIQRATMPEWLDLELTMAQLKALFVLNRRSPMTIGQVGEQLNVSLPTASHLVDRLVRMGLAERHEDPEDRRRMLASITPEGRERVRRLRRGQRDLLRGWFEQLDEDGLVALRSCLASLVHVAGNPKAGSAPEAVGGSHI